MKTTRTWISFVKANVEMVRHAAVILTGDGSRKCARARNRYFISTCRGRWPNLPMLAFRGCVFSACTREIESISGRSTAGRCRRANRQSWKFIRRYGVTVSRVMAEIPPSEHRSRRDNYRSLHSETLRVTSTPESLDCAFRAAATPVEAGGLRSYKIIYSRMGPHFEFWRATGRFTRRRPHVDYLFPLSRRTRGYFRCRWRATGKCRKAVRQCCAHAD